MNIIDSHQHFWMYTPAKQSWITEDMAAIRKDFLPADLHIILKQNEVKGCIAVQAEASALETDFLVRLAEKNNFIKAVVAWVDLCSVDITEKLAVYQSDKIIKGFREMLQNKEAGYMLQNSFKRGIAALSAANYCFDLLILPHQLQEAIILVQQFPNQKFVINHLAKPNIKLAFITQWEKDINTIARYENVFCKISGLVTEADHQLWKEQDFIPYLDIIVKAFGTKRILFGSDWPVCLLAADYKKTLAIVSNYFTTFSFTEQEDFFGNNAIAFYKL